MDSQYDSPYFYENRNIPRPPQPVVPPAPPIMPPPMTPEQPILPPECPFYRCPNFPNYGRSPDSGTPMPYMTSDPPPVLSNNPEELTIMLFKELTGFPNYGNPSGNADILYTGNRGVWTFRLPREMINIPMMTGKVFIRAILDDNNTPVNRYSARITINGTVVHNGPVPLPHGKPAGSKFDNWKTLTFNIRNPKRENTIEIRNTSNAQPNDWIGLDWMEFRIMQR